MDIKQEVKSSWQSFTELLKNPSGQIFLALVAVIVVAIISVFKIKVWKPKRTVRRRRRTRVIYRRSYRRRR